MNRWCAGCKARIPTFEKYCDGIEGDWTIGGCEEAKKKARQKWTEEELNRTAARRDSVERSRRRGA
jgi:hypothetical protein